MSVGLRKFGELDTSEREAVRVNLFASQDEIKQVAAPHKGSAAAEGPEGVRARAASGTISGGSIGGRGQPEANECSDLVRSFMIFEHKLFLQGPWMIAGTSTFTRSGPAMVRSVRPAQSRERLRACKSRSPCLCRCSSGLNIAIARSVVDEGTSRDSPVLRRRCHHDLLSLRWLSIGDGFSWVQKCA